jgi:hypothetical protein
MDALDAATAELEHTKQLLETASREASTNQAASMQGASR